MFAMPSKQPRRSAIKNLVMGSLAMGALPALGATPGRKEDEHYRMKGNINHSFCRWCYGGIPMEDLCAATKKMNIPAIDLVGPKDWPMLQKYGLYSSMCNGAELNLVDGWNHKEFHAQLIKNYSDMIDLAKKAGYKNIICFSGSRRGLDDETGWKNCTEGLKQIMSLAEKNEIFIVMELLNSKVDHKDYQCDRTPWGVELVKRVGSPNFKLLYDIYHMQIDEGDVIRTIRDNFQYIAHYHTGGVPGRHEINESQELYYPAIMQAIVDLGYKGYVAQEFIPTAKDAAGQLAALQSGVRICDV